MSDMKTVLVDMASRLFNDLCTRHKAYLQISCASHFMMWEESKHHLQ